MPETMARELIAALLEGQQERASDLIQAAARAQPFDVAEALKAEADRQLFVLPQRAMSMANAIEELGTLAQQPRIQAFGAMTAADSLRAQGHYPRALAEYDRAGRLYLMHGDEVGWARTRLGSANARVYTIELGPALEEAERARSILADHRLWVRLARLESAIGNLLSELGRGSEALVAHQRSAEIVEHIDATEERDLVRAEVQINRAAAHMRLDQYDEADVLLTDAAETFRRYARPGGMAIAESNRARTLVARGHVSRGLALASEIRERMLELGRISNACIAGLVAVECLLELNRSEEAASLADAIAAQLSANGATAELAKTLLQRAVAYERLEQYARAAEDLAQAEGLFRTAGSAGWAALVRLHHAQVLERTGSLGEALAGASAARQELFARRQVVAAARADVFRAALYRKLGQPDAARRAARAARRNGVRRTVPLLDYQASRILGELAEDAGDTRAALRAFSSAITALERSQGRVLAEQRAGFLRLQDRLGVYAAAIRLCMQRGDVHRAFVFAERAKARALLDALALRAAGISARPDTPAAQTLSAELGALRRRYDRLTTALLDPTPQDELGASTAAGHGEILQAELEDCEARIGALVERLRLTEVENIEHLAMLQGKIYSPTPYLDTRTALVEYAVIGKDIFIFVVRRGHPVEAQRAPADAVQHILRARRGLELNLETITSGRREPALEKQAIALLQRMYSVLLQPVEDLIAGSERLVIVPHGVLHGIPFAALHDGAEYLVQRCEVVLEPSASAVKFYRRPQRRARADRALVIAHSAGGLLPGATREAEGVAGLFGADHLFETEASVDNVRRATACARDVVHIAAHGRSRRDAPLFSHIRLANGQLTALDCLELRLDCELVTLSACETGHAVVEAGDEPIGLTRSLLYAGARSVIQSLWRVDDDMTRRLMFDLYTRLRAGASRAAALREAQCAFLSGDAPPREKHPAFWAAFSLVGDWRSLA